MQEPTASDQTLQILEDLCGKGHVEPDVWMTPPLGEQPIPYFDGEGDLREVTAQKTSRYRREGVEEIFEWKIQNTYRLKMYDSFAHPQNTSSIKVTRL